MQFFLWGHGCTELQQLQRDTVFQVDLRRFTATEAAQKAQGGPRALPGRHPLRSGGAGNQRAKSLLSMGHDLKERRIRI